MHVVMMLTTWTRAWLPSISLLITLIAPGSRARAQDTSEVRVVDAKCEDNMAPCEVRLGHSLRLHVQGLTKYTGNVSKLILFVNGVPLKGVNALPTGNDGDVRFYLAYEKGSESAWRTLLHEPKVPYIQESSKPMVPVTFGPEGGLPFNSAATMQLGYFDNAWFIGWVLFVSVIFPSLIWKFRHALQVPVAPGPQAAGPFVASAFPKTKYSLGRVQLAFWLYLVLSAYLFVFAVTLNMNLITPALVGLLGVSGFTAFGSAATDAKRASPQRSVVDAVEQQGLATGAAEEDDPRRAGQFRNGNRNSWLPSFFSDILSDGTAGTNGTEIYRLQNVLWTLTLGIVFIRTVWNNLVLPDLDANLVLLVGVSWVYDKFVGDSRPKISQPNVVPRTPPSDR